MPGEYCPRIINCEVVTIRGSGTNGRTFFFFNIFYGGMDVISSVFGCVFFLYD